MSASWDQVLSSVLDLYADVTGGRRERRRQKFMRTMFPPMKVTIKNHGAGRVRKDLLPAWVENARRNPEAWLVVSCPRCAFTPSVNGEQYFIDLNTAPVGFDVLLEESPDGLHRREINQCTGCHLVIAESYFVHDYPRGREAVIHLIQPEG